MMRYHRMGINRPLALLSDVLATGFLKNVTSRFLDHRSRFGKPTMRFLGISPSRGISVAVFTIEGGLARCKPLAYVSAHE